jgi:EmrB/QacA subfamily drug resistance transporter
MGLTGRPVATESPGGAWILVTTILGSSMAFIDGTVVTVALPVIQSTLGATMPQVQWIVESYALLLAALLLLGGSLGDRFGRRRVYITGIVIFGAASLWCGLISSAHELIIARTVQGVGAALLVPGSLAIISACYPDEERGRAIGTWSAFTAITAAIGPVLGGWLVGHASWRWAFFINVPLGVLVVILAAWSVPESRSREARGTLDWPGALLATLGLGSVVYGLIESSGRGWSHPAVYGACLAGCFLLVFFVIREGISRSPMVPLSLFRSRNFSGANGLTFFLYTALGGALFFLPFNLIQVQGYSPAEAGASLVPFILIMFFLSRWAGGLVARYGARLPLVAGPLVAGLGFALFGLPGVGGTYWHTFFAPACVLGLGMAVTVAPLTTTVMGAAGRDKAGVASGINNAVSRVGSLLAVALFGIILVHSFGARIELALSDPGLDRHLRQSIVEQKARLGAITIPPGTPSPVADRIRRDIAESYVAGFRWVMATAAMLSLLSAIVSWLVIDRGKKEPTEPTRKEGSPAR